MPNLKQHEILMTKAGQDEYLLNKVANDPDAPIELFGFHAQQAVEKMLKAILASEGVDYPLTRDLEHLFELISSQGLPMPEKFLALRDLMPFAVEFRYDVYPRENESPLDTKMILRNIKKFRVWVEKFLRRKT